MLFWVLVASERWEETIAILLEVSIYSRDSWVDSVIPAIYDMSGSHVGQCKN